MDRLHIRCPKCGWEPDGGEHWECDCGTCWNTFETVGVCPGCNRKWEMTQCPGPGEPGGCGAWSPHEDWYVIPIDMEALMGREKAGKVRDD